MGLSSQGGRLGVPKEPPTQQSLQLPKSTSEPRHWRTKRNATRAECSVSGSKSADGGTSGRFDRVVKPVYLGLNGPYAAGSRRSTKLAKPGSSSSRTMPPALRFQVQATGNSSPAPPIAPRGAPANNQPSLSPTILAVLGGVRARQSLASDGLGLTVRATKYWATLPRLYGPVCVETWPQANRRSTISVSSRTSRMRPRAAPRPASTMPLGKSQWLKARNSRNRQPSASSEPRLRRLTVS